MSIKDPPIVAVVVEPYIEGHNGPFFVAECIESKIKITVSLKPDVWLESDRPEGGIKVFLWKIRSKRKGWRAYRARFYGLSDAALFNKEEARE